VGGFKSSKDKELPKIKVIFTVAIAVRKFQKLESNKFIKSLTYNFDKQAALNELTHIYAADKAFFLKDFVKLAYFIRKFTLTFEDLSSLDRKESNILVHDIYEQVKNSCCTDADQKLLHFLCLSLKYLSQNSCNESIGNPLEISSIASLIGVCVSPIVQNELVTLMACRIESLCEVLSSDQSDALETLVLNLPELKQDAKVFFLSKLENNQIFTQHEIVQKNKDDKFGAVMSVRKVERNQQVVTKTIQTVKSKDGTKISEETDFVCLNLSNCMNRNRRMNYNKEPDLENTDSKDGSDRSMFRSTWAETINLFSLMKQNLVIKDDDKDNYLPDKFLGRHFFRGKGLRDDASKLYSFLINRMCASIFLKVSQTQQLNDKAIDKLLKCATKFNNLLSVLNVDSDYTNMFVNAVFQRYWQLKNAAIPRAIVRIVTDIMNKTTEEYVNRGWIYNSKDVKRKS